MIKPYTAVGLIPTVRGIRKREDIAVNLEHIAHMVQSGGLALQPRSAGAADRAARGRAAGLQRRGARSRSRAVRARMRDRHSRPRDRRARRRSPATTMPSSWRRPRRTIPTGRIAFSMSASSSTPRARSSCSTTRCRRCFRSSIRSARTTSSTGGSRSTACTLDAFWPVADTEIGRLGIMMANEGSYPENARALAMNGAEVVYRGSYPHPATGNELFEIQSRARALDNNMYISRAQPGNVLLSIADSDLPIDTFGGRSFIIDYRGQIVGRQEYGGRLDLRRPA